MDVLPRITQQFIDRIREMSRVQRGGFLALVLLVACSFAGLFVLKNRSDFQPVSYGKLFDPSELASAERAFVNAGLTGFRRDGQRLMVPGQDLDRYNATLLEFDALPADLGSQMLKQYETLGPFSTDRQRQQMKEALLLQELRRMIKAVPDIQEARVAIASSERKLAWNQKPRATANVTITPRTGHTISAKLVNSLRHVVASMVPDLQPSDVTIFDVSLGQVYTGNPVEESTESGLSSDDQALSLAQESIPQYEQQISKALSYIPHVGVVVQIDREIFQAALARTSSNSGQPETPPVANRPASIENVTDHLTGFRGSTAGSTHSRVEIGEQRVQRSLPKAIRVSVSIPRDYLQRIAKRQNGKRNEGSQSVDLSTIEENCIAKVERIVGRLIPDGAARNAIAVTCVDRVEDGTQSPANLYSQSGLFQANSRWLGGIVLGTLVVFAIGRFLRRQTLSRNAVAVRNLPEDETMSTEIPAEWNSPNTTGDRVSLLDDEVRELVQSDLGASADLLSRWLSEATR